VTWLKNDRLVLVAWGVDELGRHQDSSMARAVVAHPTGVEVAGLRLRIVPSLLLTVHHGSRVHPQSSLQALHVALRLMRFACWGEKVCCTFARGCLAVGWGAVGSMACGAAKR
jgi:hypothetical protein